MAVNTTVMTPALVAGAADVGANTGVLGGAVAGGAVTAAGAVPAGLDDASLLASTNVAAHTSNFLAVIGQNLVQHGQLAAWLGTAGVKYEVEDDANAGMFPVYGPPV